MTDPKRWSEAPGIASSFEQLLVRSGQDLSMPSDQKSETWQRILGAIPVTATPTGPTSDNASFVANDGVASKGTSDTHASLQRAAGNGAAQHGSILVGPVALKVVGFIIATAGVGALLHHLGTASSHVAQVAPQAMATQLETRITAADANSLPSETSSAESALPSVAPVNAPESNATPRTLLPTTRSSASAVGNTSAPSIRASQLRAESQATLDIRQALRSNDVAMALKLLDRAQKQFGVGALNEEREALMIESLARSGNRVQASARAKAFLTAHPRSPHASDVRRYVAE
ncbi:MAG TPA: hypothetical protein VIV60_00270 [Polyangiaceae bacterium]